MSAMIEHDKYTEAEENLADDEDESGEGDCQHIFPQRLMSVLADERNHEAICWLPHGRAFVIRNRPLFADKVMPKFFPRKSKYSSFTRKLNRWNFIRVSSGPELGAYYHEFFLRDSPHLAAQMFCKNARTKVAMASPDPNPATTMASINNDKAATIAAQQLQQQGQSRIDAAKLFFATQQIDPVIHCLIEQQLILGRKHLSAQLRLQQDPRNILLHTPMSNAAASLALEMEIQKQQQERLIQLQQMIGMNNLHGQKKRKNNFRASAA